MNEQLKIIISAQIDNLKKNVEAAQQKISSFKSEVQKASKDVDGHMKSMGDAAVSAGKAMATAFVAVGAALIALGASTAEYRNEQAKLLTAFEAAGGGAEQATLTYNGLYRVLGDSGQATEAASHLAQLTTSEKELSEWTTICQGAYATFGDSLPIESLTEAVNETAKTGQVTGALADALNWAGISEEEFQEKLDACVGETERELLMRQTLNGVYGDAAAMYEENNAALLAQNEAQAALQATTAQLGEAVQPVITAFTQFGADALAAVVPYIQQIATDYGPQLTSVLGTTAEIVGEIMGFVAENFGLLSAMAGVIAGICTAIGIYNGLAAIKKAMDAAEVTTLGALVAVQWAHVTATMAAMAPYLLIVAAIAAVIAIIVICVKHWDEIKEAVANAWEWIKEKTQAAVEAVVEWFENMKAKIQEKIEAAKEVISNVFSAIKSVIQSYLETCKTIVTSIFDGIKTAIQTRIETAKTIITNIIAAIKAIFSGDFGAAKEAVLNIFDAIKNGIKTRIENAKNTVSNVINAIKGFFNFSWSLPHLKMPHLTITGSFSIAPPSVPKFSISWYEKGGVFDNTTLFGFGNGLLGGLGENGAEAVVPLENNLGWLDKLAGMLSERMGGGTPIVLTVDGKVFAQTAISTINQQTKQTGKLALNLM